MKRIGLARIATGACRDGLDALAFTVAQQAEGVRGEGGAAPLVVEMSLDNAEVLREPALSVGVYDEFEVHTQEKPLIAGAPNFFDEKLAK